jgi:hypothetical protein
MSGMGDTDSDIAAALTAASNAYIATTCPTGTAMNTTLGVCQTVGASAAGSGSGGFLLLVLLAVMFMSGGK